ncbi:hypothetical protein GQF01_27990 [Paenibacillus sp. 5J-6]|uniref:Uncharacterized protein n=1 Tax=Paenibacillus silvestris TaxID=2606219 RepID=A0A6L8V6E1_9BACL|nr:hypothetical protein [Paenibacillus silvestris]MZQ85948.1 hypothetical protein [Paenibacillus silvestris]
MKTETTAQRELRRCRKDEDRDWRATRTGGDAQKMKTETAAQRELAECRDDEGGELFERTRSRLRELDGAIHGK